MKNVKIMGRISAMVMSFALMISFLPGITVDSFAVEKTAKKNEKKIDRRPVCKVVFNKDKKDVVIYMNTFKTKDEFIKELEEYIVKSDSDIKSADVEEKNIQVSKLAPKYLMKTFSTRDNKDKEVKTLEETFDEIIDENHTKISTVEKVRKVIKIKHRTVVKKTSKLRKTTKKVVKGSDGRVAKTYTVKKINGRAVKKTSDVDTKVIVKPRNRVVYKGTGSVRVKRGKTYKGTEGDEVVDFAKKFVGNPYVYGGTSLTRGTDCSGFVMSVYKHFGFNLPRVGQHCVGKRVSLKNIKPGDVLTYPGHVAIYAGNGQVVHAVNYRWGIKVTPIVFGNRPYMATRYIA